MSKKNILIVSTFFPPQQHIAVNRVVAYAKYLSVDHNVTVVTCGEKEIDYKYEFDNGASCRVFYLPNNSLFKRFLFYTGKENKIIHKLKTLVRIVFNQFDISHYYKWRGNAKVFLARHLSNNSVDVVLSSYAPEDALEASYQALLKNKLNSVKWVLDMRDEYSDEIGLLKHVKEKRVTNETKYSKRADLVLAVSKPQLDLYKLRMPYANNFIELRNGFDHNIKPTPYSKDSKLKIGFFGTLHGAIKPDNLFKSILQLGLKEEVEVYFAVKQVNFDVPEELKKCVKTLPFMEYKEAIKSMSNMTLCLLIVPITGRVGLYSGKLFDYLSTGRSIFAITNLEDVAADLILQNKCGYVSDFNKPDSINSTLKNIYNDWKSGDLVIPSKNEIGKFHRKHQVQKLIDWLNIE